MIVPMLMFNIVTFAFLTVSYDGIPVWLRIILFAFILMNQIIAYASEDNLRDKIKCLEDEVKNLKKGGKQK